MLAILAVNIGPSSNYIGVIFFLHTSQRPLLGLFNSLRPAPHSRDALLCIRICVHIHFRLHLRGRKTTHGKRGQFAYLENVSRHIYNCCLPDNFINININTLGYNKESSFSIKTH